jgi:transposase
MKVNYQERIEATTTELKIIMAGQQTVTNRQKVQALYLLKSGLSQSITDVAELLGVHRITVQRWLKQYNDGGLSSLLKLRRSTGRPRVIPSEVIAGISTVRNPASLRVTKKLRHGSKITIKYPSNIKLYTSKCALE